LPYDVPGFDEALDAYYDARGWEDGVVPGAPGGASAAAD
jgi:aldehyde:ferredoxin oxidoreductase